MSDLISRQAAIKEIEGFSPPKVANESEAEAINRAGWECAINCIEAYLRTVKPIDPVKWIPCSERMPEDGKWEIFTDGKNISVERYKKDIGQDHFFPSGRWFDLDDAVAWMPLPEPYKGEA